MARIALALALLACGCKEKQASPAAPPPPDPSQTSAPDATWQYDARVSPGAAELAIEGRFPAGACGDLRVDAAAQRFVYDEKVEEAGGGCRVHYRFGLADAARALHEDDSVEAFGEAYVAAASSWLLHPAGVTPGAWRVSVERAPGDVFAIGVPHAAGAVDAWEARGASLDEAPLAAFGKFRTRDAAVREARMTVAIAPGARPIDDDALVRALTDDATALATYLGAFPIPHPLLIVVDGSGQDLHGMTLGNGGGSILLRLPAGADRRAVTESWVPTHEMVHLAMPSLGRAHAWMEEGEAVYVEPIVRARAGVIPAEKVWGDLVQNAPMGLPAPGDQGLEKTRTWGRTYWGGALFFLASDVEIRKRTGGKRSLDDAFRAIARAAGGVADTWAVERFLDVADAATGTRVLHEEWEQLAAAPGKVDTDALFAQLGVRKAPGGGVTFDDAAPLAAVRKAIAGR